MGKTKKEVNRKKIEPWKIVAFFLMLCDFVTIHLSYFLALWIRFDCVYTKIPEQYLLPYRRFITLYAIGAIALFWLFRMYRSVWKYASYMELGWTFLGSVIAAGIHALLISVIFYRMPLSYYLWGAILQFCFLVMPRFSYRFLKLLLSSSKRADEAAGRVMIIGAGSAGQMILRDINTSGEVRDKVVCFIDDDPNKWGRHIENVPIVGGKDDILTSVEKFNVTKIFYAIPSA